MANNGGIDWLNYTGAAPEIQRKMLDSYRSTQGAVQNPAGDVIIPLPISGFDEGFDSGITGQGYSTMDRYGEVADTVQDQPGFLDKLMDNEYGSMQGWGQMLGGIGNIGNAYMAYKNYGLAKDQFKFSKAYANKNMENQTALTNDDLRSRHRARSRLGGGDSSATQLTHKNIG